MSVEPELAIERRAQPRKVALDKEARLSRVLLVAIPLLAIVAVGGLRLIMDSRWTKTKIGGRLVRELVARTDSGVTLGGISFGWAYQPCLQGLSIGRETKTLVAAVKAKEACVDRWASAIGSGFRAVKLHLSEPAVTLAGLEAGASVRSLVEMRPQGAGTSSTSPALPQAPQGRPVLREYTLEFDDLTLDWRDLPLPDRIKSGSFGPIDGVVSVQRRGAQSAITLSLREPKTGLTARGRATPTEGGGWDLALTVEGDLAPTLGPILAAAGLDLRRLPVNGEVGVVYSSKARTITIDLDVSQRDVDVASKLVSARRLAGFSARERMVLEIDLAKSELRTRDALVEVNGVPITLSLVAQGNEGAPAFDASVAVPTVPMQKLLASIPGTEPVEELGGLSPSVLFALTFSVSGQLKDPETWKAKLDERVIGVGPNGAGSGLEYLRAPSWEYHPLTKEGRAAQGLAMGSKSPRWTSWNAIPYVMRRAVQVCEDASFFVHKGIDIDEIQNAIVGAMTKDERARGGSTLTQQLIKNLFLTRDRTALRKIQELLLTFLIEASLTKEQIFETYLNIIEWGPGVYGLKDAAMHYFGRPPGALSPREMAYLATIIPGPVLYHSYYEQGFVPAKHMAKVDITLDKLLKLGNLTPEQVLPADKDPIRFRR